MKWWMALGLRRGNVALVPTSMKGDLLIVGDTRNYYTISDVQPPY